MIQLYAPHELNENNYKARSTGRRKPPTVDVFKTLKLNPLVEYKVKYISIFISSYDEWWNIYVAIT